MDRFYYEELSAPRSIPKLEDYPLSAVRDCLFNIFAATLHTGGRSSSRNLTTGHAVETATGLSCTERRLVYYPQFRLKSVHFMLPFSNCKPACTKDTEFTLCNKETWTAGQEVTGNSRRISASSAIHLLWELSLKHVIRWTPCTGHITIKVSHLLLTFQHFPSYRRGFSSLKVLV